MMPFTGVSTLANLLHAMRSLMGERRKSPPKGPRRENSCGPWGQARGRSGNTED